MVSYMMDTLSFKINLDPLAERAPSPHMFSELEALVHNIILYTNSNLMQLDGIDKNPVGTLGIHLKAAHPHAHLHLQYQSPLWVDHGKKNAAHMKAWFKANKFWCPTGQDLTLKVGLAHDQDSIDDHLSYPLKEGNPATHSINSQNGPDRMEFLTQRGQGIFAAEERARAQKLARETKSKNIVSQLLEIAQEHFSQYPSLVDLRRVVLDKFFNQFTTPLDYPNMNDVKNAWQKVAVYMRIVATDYYLN